jgi:hypothetical protein
VTRGVILRAVLYIIFCIAICPDYYYGAAAITARTTPTEKEKWQQRQRGCSAHIPKGRRPVAGKRKLWRRGVTARPLSPVPCPRAAGATFYFYTACPLTVKV